MFSKIHTRAATDSLIKT